ncbi:MAG: sodium/proline symporter [bacterium]|nr:sodium/proline symporter [bacterium]
MNLIAISFFVFLAIFMGIGVYSATRARSGNADYYLAGRDVPPWLAALSAVATNNSGFMFIGLIGMTYASGLSSIWIMTGWVLGDYIAWRTVHQRLRVVSGEMSAESIPEILGGDSKGAGRRLLLIVGGLLILFFLGLYAAAQLKAGSKALHVLFGWHYSVGATIGFVIVVAYCFSGGLRASIWTDAAQAIVMGFAMLLLLAFALLRLDGFSGLFAALNAIDPKLLTLIPENLEYGFVLFALSWVAAGIGVTGQPHIMVRAMAIDSPDGIVKARRIYFLYYVPFTIAAIIVGLCCRALLVPEAGVDFDAELALPELTRLLFPDVLVGLTLAGLFAATMSTADSQVLACSAALTNDTIPEVGSWRYGAKSGTLFVASVAYAFALYGPDSVFALVVDAWAALASGLGPLLIVRVFRRPVATPVALGMMLAGLGTVLAWWQLSSGIQSSIYAVMPGMLAGFLVFGIAEAVGSVRNSR